MTWTKTGIKKFFKENYEGWLFNLPLTIGLLIFTLIPVCYSLYVSFYSLVGRYGSFVGLGNYQFILTRDPDFWKVCLNTLIYTVVNIPLSLTLSYLLAVLVNRNVKGVKGFRVVYYLPCIIPAVASGLLWKDLLDPTYGIFNKMITGIGLPSFPFFSSPNTSMFTIFVISLWSVGGGMILWLAAFKNIPKELYESASLDGANAIDRLVHITIPMSTAMIFYNVIMSVIGSLQYNGTLTFAPNKGMGQDESVYMYAVMVYRNAFQSGKIGIGSAMSWLLLIVIGLITIVLFKTSKWVFYGEDA